MARLTVEELTARIHEALVAYYNDVEDRNPSAPDVTFDDATRDAARRIVEIVTGNDGPLDPDEKNRQDIAWWTARYNEHVTNGEHLQAERIRWMIDTLTNDPPHRRGQREARA